MPDAVRVRFAPSPTGLFHVGGARSALFNWTLARSAQRSLEQGRFVLRIEDTDAGRNRPEWVAGIISALAAIGISGDDPAFEGPYFQSGSAGAQREAARRLFTEGRAYYCDCTREDLAGRTGSPQRGYDGYCRGRGLAYEPGRALRFRTPDGGTTVVDDVIRGRTEFPNDAMEDFVLARGDGTPVFVLANAVDDIRERITHVVRGEEHLSNAPKQQLLWEAFGAAPPVWAHLPVIVNEQRQKLSKRRDKVALEDYLAEGYLPAALVNYLMLLGWGPRDGVRDPPLRGAGGAVPAGGREQGAGLLRRQEAGRVQRRIHPRPQRGGVHRGLPALAGRPVRALGRGAVRRRGVPVRRRAGPDPAGGAQPDHDVRGLAIPGPAAGRRSLMGQGHEAGRGGRPGLGAHELGRGGLDRRRRCGAAWRRPPPSTASGWPRRRLPPGSP